VTKFTDGSNVEEMRGLAAFVLGISVDARQSTALAAYQSNLKVLHPRVSGDPTGYQTLLAAWAVWNQLSEHASGGTPRLRDLGELRAARLRSDDAVLSVVVEVGDHVDASDRVEEVYGCVVEEVYSCVVEEVDGYVVEDRRNERYEIDLVTFGELPAAHRAYLTAGSTAAARTAAGSVDYAL
jgi:hypothetical protein